MTPEAADRQAARAAPLQYMRNIGAKIDGLPESLQEGYAHWFLFGIMPGSFLRAVIRGDLYGAYAHADEWNRPRLYDIARWFAANGDARCMTTSFDAWGDRGGLLGNAGSRK